MTGMLRSKRAVALEAGRPEVAVHLVVAPEELLVVVAADRDHEREADRARKRIAAADPVPEAEHVLRVDAERGDFLRGRRDGDEVLRDGGFGVLLGKAGLLRLGEEPLLGGERVGHRLLRRERLGRDDEERLSGLYLAERLREVRRVDVGDKEELHVALRVGRKRDVRHYGAEVRAADADVDDVLDATTGKALPLALAHLVGEVAHLDENLANILEDILAVDLDRVGLVEIAERGVKDGAALGRVDLLAGEHLLDLFLEIRLLRKLDEGLHDLFVDAVLRVVERPARRLDGEFRGSRLVLSEQFLDRLLRRRGHCHVQLSPLVGVCHGSSSFCFWLHIIPNSRLARRCAS